MSRVLPFVLIVLLYSCSTVMEIPWGNDDLVIIDAYRQDQIPGEEDAGKQIIIFINTKDFPENVKPDSVWYKGMIAQSILRGNTIKTTMSDGWESKDNFDLSDTEVILFYRKNDEHFKVKIDIIIKEEVVLP